MNDKDILKDLFSEKLGNYEATVNPKLWSAISSQIGATTTTSVAGMSMLSKLIIGVSFSAALVTGGFLLYPSSSIIKRKSEKQVSSLSPLLVKEEGKKLEGKNVTDGLVQEEKSTFINNQKTVVEAPQIIVGFNNSSIVELITKSTPDIVSSSIENQKALPNESLISNTVEIAKTPVIEIVEIEKIVVEEKIKLPNIFTPNLDGVNDELKIQLNDVKDFSIVVLDSKNHIVYKSEDPDFSWNGIGLNGEMVEAGNYIYYITAKNNQGKDVLEYSSLTIVR